MNPDDIEELEEEPIADVGEDDYEEVTEPSYTYQVKDGRILNFIDERQAMIQAIGKALNTERFSIPIYSENYGSDLTDLIGKDLDYCKTEAVRMVEECLYADDRVIDVNVDEPQQTDKDTLLVTGTATTIFGDVDFKTESDINDTGGDSD